MFLPIQNWIGLKSAGAKTILSVMMVCINGGFLAADEIDFNRDIKPILSNRCFLCHGPDDSSRQADLRLDSFEAATDYAIEPKDADNSAVYLRIISADDDERMPPAEHGPALTVKEKQLIKKWISSGARYDQHWSYQKPKRTTNEFTKDNWNRNPIDGYVLAKMKKQGLSPAAMADPYSMIRRLSFDLTGLPPTVDEADELWGDGSDEAYEKMVDYYLAKPAFGERWAAMWLDHARYADSAGYAEDRSRTIWAYRDYVIRALNRNMPFDQFTIEQLAGDLLENPTEDQLIATAFHRNTLTNTEGGTVDEEFRSAAVVDRTNTTMAVWMGTTMACAQCHTHKYDPITQDEYFQFYAFFNSTADNDQPNEAPLLSIFSDKQKQRRQEFQEKADKLFAEIKAWNDKSMDQQKDALKHERALWLIQNKQPKSNHVSGRTVRIDLPKENAILSLAEVQVFHGDKNLALTGKAKQSSTAYNGPAKKAIDGNTDGNMNKNKSVTHTATESNPWWEVKLKENSPIDKIVIWNRAENLHSRLDGFEISILNDARNVVWTASNPKAKPSSQEFNVQRFPDEIYSLLRKRERTETEQAELDQYFLTSHSPTKFKSIKLSDLQRQLSSMKPETTVPIQKELMKPRDTYVHIRGSYLDRGSKVERGTPSTFHPFTANAKNRLELAKWIVAKDNPLTARVIVNRLWQQLFGIGIVATSEEFGSQGELPTHPELLDYLACEFMENGWDVKRVLKQMVMSATYRQSSTADSKKMEIDTNNRWLSRGPRFRLTAEMIRDQALMASGLLSDKMYGPPVQPPQPKFELKIAFQNVTTDWQDSVGEDRYRRAIYTRWRRSAPYPSMTTFDISNREVCELRRLRTNTPLQALVTLNDPVYIEAAQALARRVFDESKSPHEIASEAFRHALIRPAKPVEIELLMQLYRDTVAHFENDKESAAKLAIDPLNPVDAKVDIVKLAAWTTVANSILNLDEIFMKR